MTATLARRAVAPPPSPSRCSQCRSRSTCSILRQAEPSSSYSSSSPERSHHQRPLPVGLVAFSSEAGRIRFAQALLDGQAEAYFPLSEQFVTQSEVAYCGLATLTMCMNALRVDPKRIWKDAPGPGWRWWTDEMFPTQCSGSFESIRAEGVTMDMFDLMARANGATVTMRRPTDRVGSDLAAFRACIVDAAEMRSGAFTVAAFCRSRLGQTGGGHFSPVAGYHAESDSALVLDVARFKYPPYWVPVPDLYDATCATDPITGRSRGWFTLTAEAAEASA